MPGVNSKLVAAGGLLLVVLYFLRRKPTRKSSSDTGTRAVDKKKVTVDKEFWRQLKSLLKIVIPGATSKEFLLLVFHTAFLVVRTWLSIIVAQMDGEIVKTIVSRNPAAFTRSMVKWLALGIPATYTNSMIRYLESKLAIAFRTRMVDHSYKIYMEDETYYRVGNLDSRLANADQCLTEDISKFCSLLAHLHSQLSKPILDVTLMSIKLWTLGRERNPTGSGASRLIPTAIAFFVIWLTARVLRLASPPFGKMAAEQAEREGELRYVHSRLIANSEEIAFYGGHAVEQGVLERTYLSLVKHTNAIFKARIFYTMVEGFFMKYVWSATGLMMVALPTFMIPEKTESELLQEGLSAVEETSERTQHFITARKLLLDAADAIERMMSAYKEVTELAGYTHRVYEMVTVFGDVKKHKYQKNISSAASSLLEEKGTIIEGATIKLEDVPIVTPNGDVLVQSMSLECAPGMHLLITGPNGCGKSSLFRMIGGLWPIYGGRMTKPKRSDLFYIPQRPYLALGSLRDQIIYPDSVADMKRKGFSDDKLLELMDQAHLKHIVQREGGWDAVNDWMDVLSGGEKQRVGMARLFYHKPKYAILDECTSAVSIDVEGRMYTHAIELGITLMTVTHRPSLWKYHKFLLQYDGEGGFKFGPLDAGHRLSLKDEKTQLEADLQNVPKKQKRLKELCQLLGEDSIVLKQVLQQEAKLSKPDDLSESEEKTQK